MIRYTYTPIGWEARIDGYEPDAITGHGRSMDGARFDLIEQIKDIDDVITRRRIAADAGLLWWRFPCASGDAANWSRLQDDLIRIEPRDINTVGAEYFIGEAEPA